MGEQSLTYFAYVCFMRRNDGVFLPYCCAYHELCVRTRKNTLSNETASKAVNFFIPRAESIPCSGCLSLICICSSNASLSAHQANASLSFLKRARSCPPELLHRFRSENLIIYTLHRFTLHS